MGQGQRPRAQADELSTQAKGGLPEATARSQSEPQRALTSNEREVMTMLAHGATVPEIAEALVISSETVRSRTRTAREKLGAKTRTHAVALAVHSGEIRM